MRLRAVVGAVLISLALSATLAGAADTASTESARGPSGCPPEMDPTKWICLTIPEAGDVDARLAALKAERDAAWRKLGQKQKRFGWNLGIGGGIGYEPSSPVGASVDTGFYLTWGLRF
jgi:hypothetical protein